MTQLQRLFSRLGTTRDGFNNGLIMGGVFVFFILIGLPASLPGREALAPLALPLFLLIAIAFGVHMVRQAGEDAKWGYLISNGIAIGIGAGLVFLLFMGLINRWQSRGFDVVSYFNEVRLASTARLSGVDEAELFPNPEIDRTTQEMPEDAVLRTNPMTLAINNDDIVVYDLGLITIGGLYGTALGFLAVALLTVVVYRAITLVDWQTRRREFRDSVYANDAGRSFAEFLPIVGHWIRLFSPIFFFALFLLSTSMSYDTGFWRGILGDSSVDEMPQGRSTLLNLSEIFDVKLQARQNLQLIIVFSMIITLLMAWRSLRSHVEKVVPLIVRIGIFISTIFGLVVLAVWRIVSDEVTFISPTLEIGKLNEMSDVTASLVIVTLVAIGLLIYVLLNIMDGQKFESTFVGVMGIGLLLTIPLFMDQYQTSVMNLVAINIMLGLGLNIVVGYAGLLDLGYVAFYAIGAYVYAFVASDRQHLAIGHANHIMFLLVTAIVIVPVIIFGGAIAWNRQSRPQMELLSDDKHKKDGSMQSMAPLWRNQPPLAISLMLVVLAVSVAFGTTWILKNIGVFDGVGRASPFVLGMILAVMASAFTGAMLGFPVLRLRSDYLAIVTLGFGEIISISLENLEDLTGGPFGANNIPKPLPTPFSIDQANLVILYIAFIGAGAITLISLRLKSSRLGRAWTALRSDEDIAQAMGINLVNVKLLAFSIGASFAGLAGLLFAARQSNIFPNNFSLQISINVLAVVIIGGMGSVPGVIVGAIALVGLPEMLRAVRDYRTLAFGAVLVIMMLIRPGGLMPAPLTSLEEKARQLRRERQGYSPAENEEAAYDG